MWPTIFDLFSAPTGIPSRSRSLRAVGRLLPILEVACFNGQVNDDQEEEARLETLAERLVAAALKNFEQLLPPKRLKNLRVYMVDELLCTPYGRERLQRLRSVPVSEAIAEFVRGNEQLSELERERSG